MSGFWFGAWGLGFRVWGLGLMGFMGLGGEAEGLGRFRIEGFSRSGVRCEP